jgi:hypothetical protein
VQAPVDQVVTRDRKPATFPIEAGSQEKPAGCPAGLIRVPRYAVLTHPRQISIISRRFTSSHRFFDRVNHDILMSRVPARVTDKRVLKLIRAFLNAGVLEDGLIRPVDEGTPQGGPLSPFLSNIVLDDLDKELARRGHRFCRYADDCNIYVRSHRAGERVMASITRFLTDKLRLKVNEAKSAVARPEERKGSVLRTTAAKDALRRKRSLSSKTEFGT